MDQRQRPTQIHGVGEPICVGHAERRRLLSDGAGLCSPGLRPPERRFMPTAIASQIHDALDCELSRLGRSLPGGLTSLLNDLSAGRVTEIPFPADATDRLRAYVHDITEAHRVELEPTQKLRKQLIDVLLLGSVLRAINDPDWRVMSTYASGVPLGLGVDLPRIPFFFS